MYVQINAIGYGKIESENDLAFLKAFEGDERGDALAISIDQEDDWAQITILNQEDVIDLTDAIQVAAALESDGVIAVDDTFYPDGLLEQVKEMGANISNSRGMMLITMPK